MSVNILQYIWVILSLLLSFRNIVSFSVEANQLNQLPSPMEDNSGLNAIICRHLTFSTAKSKLASLNRPRSNPDFSLGMIKGCSLNEDH